MAKWHHLREDPMGGSTGEAYFSTLNNNNYSAGERLARESLQNSRDAVREGLKLRAEYQFRRFTGKSKRNFVEALNLAGIAERKQFLGLKGDNCLERLGKDGQAIRALYVSDYNTIGLHGHLQDRHSHFRRLLLTLGDRQKSREGSTVSGGSYGFGKAVYTLSSNVRVIVAYSRFDEHKDSGVSARLMGSGYHQPYECGKNQYNGRSIFGVPAQTTDGRKTYDAISNKQAHALAEQLGFTKRDEGDSGTSILILDPIVDPDDLVHGIETWWWPALVENTMDVRVIDESGTTHVPRPRNRSDLRPFIDAFGIATGLSKPLGKHQEVTDWNRVDKYEIGKAAVALVDENTQKQMSDERINSIAMIRGPRMVVRYYQMAGVGPSIAGSYLASDDVESWLRTSEPPAHDIWDERSADLAGTPVAGQAIRAIHKRLKDFCAQFRRRASPPPDASRRSLRVFETMLGRLFRNRANGKPSPPLGNAAPVHIAFSKQPQPQSIKGKNDLIKFATRFSLSLDDEFTKNNARIKVDLKCDIVEDEGTQGDPLPLHVTIAGGALMKEDGSYIGQIRKGEPIAFEVESEPYDRMWSVRFAPELEVDIEGQDK